MEQLTAMKMDALAESGNISMGSAATALSELLGHRVQITTPRLSYTTLAKIRESFPIPCVLVRVRYNTGLEGSNIFILSDRDAGIIANMMMGDADKPVPPMLDELYLSALSEAMNQMMGSSATALSEMYNRKIDITPPDVEYVDLRDGQQTIDGYSDDTELIQIAFDLTVGDYINSKMLQLLPPSFADQLVAELLDTFDSAADVTEEVEEFEETEEIVEELPELSAYEADTVAEIVNISMGSAATTLSLILSRRVAITTPRVAITTLRQVQQEVPEPSVLVNVQYLKGLVGDNLLIIRERDALVIAALMMGESPDEPGGSLDEIRVSAVSEAMNQMLGSSCTALSEMFSRPIEIAPPKTDFRVFQQGDLPGDNPDEPMVQVRFRIEIKDLIDSEMIQLLPLDFTQDMVGTLMESLGVMKSEPEVKKAPVPKAAKPPAAPPEPEFEEEIVVDYPEEAEPEPSGKRARQVKAPNTREPVFSEPVQSAAVGATRDEGTVQLDLLRDIPVRVTGLLGHRTLSLKELMAVKAGTVMELECPADAPVDILANGKLVARGEVVVYDERFGIKITEIVQPWQRN